MIQPLVPLTRERQWGRVIQIGGGLAQQPRSAAPQYSATLAARHNLAVSLARELEKDRCDIQCGRSWRYSHR